MLPLNLKQACNLRARLIAKKYAEPGGGLNAMEAAILEQLNKQVTTGITLDLPTPEELETWLVEEGLREMGFEERT